MESNVEMLIGKMEAAGKQFEISNIFGKLKTDQERVAFTLGVMREYDMIPNATDIPKDAEKSERLRKKGNEIFVKSGSDNAPRIQALSLYSKSVAFAPYPSVQLALAYANRSAVLFELGLYSECVQDIDRALAANYPDDMRAKLYVRKAHCLVLLGNQPAEDTIEETIRLLEKTSLSKDQVRLRTKLDVLRKTVKTDAKVTHAKHNCMEQKNAKNMFHFAVVSPNSEVPCASDAIAIGHNEYLGRYVVATRDIRPGEVIAVEKPYSLLLKETSMRAHCSNCLEICWANIPCKYCTYAMYCSEECRDIEWKKCHDIECSVFPILIKHACFNIDLFSLRLVVLAVKEAGGIQQLRTMLNEADKWDDPRTKGFTQDGKLYSDKYIGVYNLVRNTEKRHIADLFRRSMDASFISYILATCTTMFDTKLPKDLDILAKNDDVVFLGGLILRHQQLIGCNFHSFDEERDSDNVSYGLAAMPFLSLINHSCNPNITRTSMSKHIVVHAVYPIKKGEQILDNYGQHYAMMPKLMRQQYLCKQYSFICNCIACLEEWPLYIDLKSYEILVKKANDKAKIKKALKNFGRYVELLMEGNILDKSFIIKDLLMMLQVLYDYAPMPCTEMNNVVESLKRAYDLSGNRYVEPKVVTL